MDKYYDIVIIGAGASGIGCAYALINSGMKVLLIDKYNTIGGTHINAWVNIHAATPAPPFLRPIIEKAIMNKRAIYLNGDYHPYSSSEIISYEMSLLHSRYSKFDGKEINICFDPEYLRNIYISDFNNGCIDVKPSTSVIGVVNLKDGIVEAISAKNIYTNEINYYYAKAFIDCSTDNILIKGCGIDMMIGSDGYKDFEQEYGFIEHNNKSLFGSKFNLNYPTLMYRCKNGNSEQLEQKGFTEDALIYSCPDNFFYINTISYLQMNGFDALSKPNESYSELASRVRAHWSAIKSNKNNPRLLYYHLENKVFDSYAPMLGIRETYRIKAERLLNENNLYKKVSSKNIKDGDLLDRIIAVGNHPVDIHGSNVINVDTNTINKNLHPYGVPYGCIIPKGLKNVLVASRSSGFTHIAASSFRLNKDMMQLGWAAGHSAKLFVSCSNKDFRNIDIDLLQSSSFTDIVNTVKKLEQIMK